MRPFVLLVLAASLGPLACSRAEAGDMAIGAPNPQGSLERIDRLQFLGNASSAMTRAEDAFAHQKAGTAGLTEAMRLIDLARRSAVGGNQPVEAAWEGQAFQTLSSVEQAMGNHNAATVADGLAKARLYLDQAQQAASIEY